MRDRSWRRYTQDKKVKKRLIRHISSSPRFIFFISNNIRKTNPMWFDYIGLKESFFFRSHTTSRDNNRKLDSLGTRELDKIDFLKILKENGLR